MTRLGKRHRYLVQLQDFGHLILCTGFAIYEKKKDVCVLEKLKITGLGPIFMLDCLCLLYRIS